MNEQQPREIIRLQGNCGVERAAEITQDFLQVLEKGADLDLDLSSVTQADCALQQIICSAHRTFSARNQLIRLTGRPSQAVLENLQRGGFGQVCVFTLQNCLFKGVQTDG